MNSNGKDGGDGIVYSVEMAIAKLRSPGDMSTIVGDVLSAGEGVTPHLKGEFVSVEDQPAPDAYSEAKPDIADLVILDIKERKRVGTERYGTPLQANNGRDALVDLYQELLDAVQYVRQIIEEELEDRLESDTVRGDRR